MDVSLLLNSSSSNDTEEVAGISASTVSSSSRRRTPWAAGGYALPVLAKPYLPRKVSDGRGLSRSACAEHEIPRVRHYEPFEREQGQLMRPDMSRAPGEAVPDVIRHRRTDDAHVDLTRQQRADYSSLRRHATNTREPISLSAYTSATTSTRSARSAYPSTATDEPHKHEEMLRRERVSHGGRQNLGAIYDPMSAMSSSAHRRHLAPSSYPECDRSSYVNPLGQRDLLSASRMPNRQCVTPRREDLRARSMEVEEEDYTPLSYRLEGSSPAQSCPHRAPLEASKSSFMKNNTTLPGGSIPSSDGVRREKRNLGQRGDSVGQDRASAAKQPDTGSSPSHFRVQSGGMSTMPEVNINQIAPSHSSNMEGLAYNPTSNDQPFIMPVPKCLYIADCSTGVKFRKTCSHLFGRNKLCTKQIPEQLWVHYCRKHYQRARYRNNKGWPFIQCHLAKEMLNRLDAWSRHNIHHGLPGRVLDWTVKIRKRSQSAKSRSKRRKISTLERILDDKVVALDEAENESGEDDDTTGVVPDWLPELVGSGYDYAQVIDMLDRIQHDLENNAYNQIPDVEFLPNIDEDDARRDVGASRPTRLKHQRSQSLGGLPTSKHSFPMNRPSTSDRALDYATAMVSSDSLTRYPKRKRFGGIPVGDAGGAVGAGGVGSTTPYSESGTVRHRSRRRLSDFGTTSLGQASKHLYDGG